LPGLEKSVRPKQGYGRVTFYEEIMIASEA